MNDVIDFTQDNMKEFLSKVFFKKTDSSFVVLKQGNWVNPQDLIKDGKPDTWIAYLKNGGRPRMISGYKYDGDRNPWSCEYKISKVDLQFVGRQAENWANSVSHWMLRGDISAFLDEHKASLMGDQLGETVITPFYQDGANTVLAYNVIFYLEYLSAIKVTNQEVLTNAEFTGTVSIN
jgi:hypothetical protein